MKNLNLNLYFGFFTQTSGRLHHRDGVTSVAISYTVHSIPDVIVLQHMAKARDTVPNHEKVGEVGGGCSNYWFSLDHHDSTRTVARKIRVPVEASL